MLDTDYQGAATVGREQREWTDSELQYSVIVSPTSPGDDRFRIPARRRRPTTLAFPFGSICLLERQFRNGTNDTISGNLIAPQVVLTAGHALHSNIGPVMSIDVSPGADLSATPSNQRPSRPSVITAHCSRFRVHKLYFAHRTPSFDYGVIILPKPFVKPDQFMLLQPRGVTGSATLVTVAGYPCDKLRGTMWAHSERILAHDVKTRTLGYILDTCGGHSGSPVWLLGNDGIRLQLAVHKSGVPGGRCRNSPDGGCDPTGAPVTPIDPPAGETNEGVRITCGVIDQIVAWCSEFRVRQPRIDIRTYRRRCGRTSPGGASTEKKMCPAPPLLRWGSRGPDVRELQRLLNRWIGNGRGSIRPLAVDEIFGPKTNTAVRAFQRGKGLVVDALVGPKTWHAIALI